jgi:hypothetical protein
VEDEMSKDRTSTRRSFLRDSALLATPVAAALVPAAVLAGDGLKARIQRLENEAAIRELHQSWLRQVNGQQGDALLEQSVRRITADQAGAADKIEIATGGASAVGIFDYAVETETALAQDCTLAQMAHAQGHGTVRRTERRMLTLNYTKADGTWKIATVSSRTL